MELNEKQLNKIYSNNPYLSLFLDAYEREVLYDEWGRLLDDGRPLGGMKMNRLRELRIKAGMSQKELGRKIDRNENTICKYEKGLREPKLNTWKILANTLHVTPQYLVGWTDDPRASNSIRNSGSFVHASMHPVSNSCGER